MSTTSSLPPFSADLTAAELLMIGAGGWEPIELVYGDCSFGLGDQVTSRRDNKTLTWISEGLTRGQGRALERMRRQAAAAGADGVIGVRVTTTPVALDDDPERHPTQHFSAVGTAVRRQAGSRRESTRPFTSHLSGQETWALSTAGCAPLGVVFGFGVYHAKTAVRRPDRCCEMPELTAGVYGARGLAMYGMQKQAAELGASGVIGVSIELKLTPGPTITFTATGTAIRTAASGLRAPAPVTVIQLND